MKQEFPDKTIWLYTGYTWEEINDLPYIGLIDVLVDGRYMEELADSSLKWKGSSKSARNPRKEKHGGKEGDSSSGINGNGSVHWPGKAL